MVVVACAVAERAALKTILPALKSQLLSAVGEVVGGIAGFDEFVPAVGAGRCGYVQSGNAHARLDVFAK